MTEYKITEIYTRERSCGAQGLRRFGVEFVIYAYHDDGYSGYGFAFVKQNDKFYFHDLGHCSCYGLFEEFTLKNPCRSLEDMFKVWKKSNFYDNKTEEISEILGIITEQFEGFK